MYVECVILMILLLNVYLNKNCKKQRPSSFKRVEPFFIYIFFFIQIFLLDSRAILPVIKK